MAEKSTSLAKVGKEPTKKNVKSGLPALVLVLVLVPSMSARAQHLPPPVPANKENRLPPIPYDRMTEAQKQAAAEYAAVRPDGLADIGGGSPNLFHVYMRVPEVLIPLLRVQENMHVHPSATNMALPESASRGPLAPFPR